MKEKYGRMPMRVIRKYLLPQYLGLGRTQIDDLIDQGLLHPFRMNPHGRSLVVTEEEVIELQKSRIAAAQKEEEVHERPAQKQMTAARAARKPR